MMNSSLCRLRAMALLAVVGAATTKVARWCVPPADDLIRGLQDHQSMADWPIERLVTDLAAGACLVATGGLALTVALALVSRLAAVRFPTIAASCSRLTPHATRRLVTAVLGVGVAAAPTAVAGLATATPSVVPCHARCADPRGSTLDGSTLDGLPFPDLPSGSWRPPTIVVHAGDSLWRIAERILPPDASSAEVAGLTNRLYRLNRQTVGPDPDLIFPGMSLRAPEGTS